MARPEPFGGLQIMTHFYLYLSIILLAQALALALLALIRQRHGEDRTDCGVRDTPARLEFFTCLEADLKEVNEGVYLCQMRFANQGRLKFEVRSLK